MPSFPIHPFVVVKTMTWVVPGQLVMWRGHTRFMIRMRSFRREGDVDWQRYALLVSWRKTRPQISQALQQAVSYAIVPDTHVIEVWISLQSGLLFYPWHASTRLPLPYSKRRIMPSMNCTECRLGVNFRHSSHRSLLLPLHPLAEAPSS